MKLSRILSKRCFSFLAAFLAASALFADRAAAGGELKVDVTDLRSEDGTVHLAIYSSPESFPKSSGKIEDMIVRAKTKSVTAVFKGLPPGKYALAVYHDENENNEFDRFLGLPVEGYAFSNKARVFFGPPAFEDAAVEVGEDGAAIVIPMTY